MTAALSPAGVRVDRRVMPWRHSDEMRTLRTASNARLLDLQTMLGNIWR